jgi:hypothetical protein
MDFIFGLLICGGFWILLFVGSWAMQDYVMPWFRGNWHKIVNYFDLPPPDPFIAEYIRLGPTLQKQLVELLPLLRAKDAVRNSPIMFAALEGSIEKWEKILKGKALDLGTKNCTLCQHYFNPLNYRFYCEGCPVRMVTGLDGCHGSPYTEYTNLVLTLKGLQDGKYKMMGRKTPQALRDAVQKEIDFLKGLRP